MNEAEHMLSKPVYRETDLILKIRALNPHIVCALCAGYYIDATTITECSHTFCKSCIVKHFQTKKSCPECGQKIHETQPMNNLRSDRVMQDVVYKLVPNLFKNEQEAEAKFYQSKGIDFLQSGSHLLNIGTPLKYTQQKVIRENTSTEVDTIDVFKIPCYRLAHRFEYDQKVTLYVTMQSETEAKCKMMDGKHVFEYDAVRLKYEPLLKRYIRCSSRATVSHLQRLLKMKLFTKLQSDIKNLNIEVYILSCGKRLHKTMTMKEVCLMQWFSQRNNQSDCIDLQYEICVFATDKLPEMQVCEEVPSKVEQI